MSQSFPSLDVFDVDEKNGVYYFSDGSKLNVSFHANGKLKSSILQDSKGYQIDIALTYDEEGNLKNKLKYKGDGAYNFDWSVEYDDDGEVERYARWANYQKEYVPVVTGVETKGSLKKYHLSDGGTIDVIFDDGRVSFCGVNNKEGRFHGDTYKFKIDGSSIAKKYDDGVLLEQKNFDENRELTRHVFFFGDQQVHAAQLKSIEQRFAEQFDKQLDKKLGPIKEQLDLIVKGLRLQ